MLRLGAHMSIAGGLDKALDRAVEVGSDAVQIFTANQRQWKGREISDEEVRTFKARQRETGIWPVVSHNSYLINLASPKDDLWEKSIAAQRAEMERCERLGIPYIVAHPGAHTGSGRDAGIQRIIAAFDRLHSDLPGYQVMTLLETTAGQGTTIGGQFEDLMEILDGVKETDRLGVCLDTCHTFVAGYDCRSADTYGEFMTVFDQLLGIERIKALHFNDSKGAFESKRDRHDYIGHGEIGIEGFRNFMNDERLCGIAGLLETDKSEDLHEDREAIELLRSLVEPKASA